jgi:preprotein translocase subunit SecF
MLDIAGKRLWFFLISGVVIVIGIIGLIVFGLKPGIEFSSGSMLRLSFANEVAQSDLRQELAQLGYTNAIVQSTGGGDFIIRTAPLAEEEKTQLETSLTTRFGDLQEVSFFQVSPMVATETASNAGIAVAIATIGILLYVTWAFRKMPRPFRYGTCGVIALAHDVLVVLGIFSILGAIMGWEINLMFITGILAVIGYSINNTVVVFDRIRENVKRGVSPSFTILVNNSVIETMGRCLNTSLTTVFTVLALLLFVGASIQNFAVVLLIGIIAGTFDSICIAPMLLVVWETRDWGRLLHPARA